MARTKISVADEVVATLPRVGEQAYYKSTGGHGPWAAVVCGVGNGADGSHTLVVTKPNGSGMIAHAFIGDAPGTFVLLSDMPLTPIVYI